MDAFNTATKTYITAIQREVVGQFADFIKSKQQQPPFAEGGAFDVEALKTEFLKEREEALKKSSAVKSKKKNSTKSDAGAAATEVGADVAITETAAAAAATSPPTAKSRKSSSTKDPNAPPQRRSDYNDYISKQMSLIKEEYPDVDTRQRMIMATQRWNKQKEEKAAEKAVAATDVSNE
jgi:hypothetical protein